MLLLLTLSAEIPPATPVSTDVPTVSVEVAWSRRSYLAVDTTGWLPLCQVLAHNGIDARRMYEIADATGLPDPRRIPVGLALTIPQ